MKSVNHPVLDKNYQLMFDEAAHEYRVHDEHQLVILVQHQVIN